MQVYLAYRQIFKSNCKDYALFTSSLCACTFYISSPNVCHGGMHLPPLSMTGYRSVQGFSYLSSSAWWDGFQLSVVFVERIN